MYKLVENIQQLCDERNITIYQLEKEAKLSNGTISKWAISSPTLINLIKVAEHLDVSLDDIIGNGKQIVGEN